MEAEKPIQGNAYRIKIKETINRDVTRWFDGLTLTPLENNGTLLTGAFPDQSALRGFLDQLWNLNFTVVSVEKVGNGLHRENGKNHPAGAQISRLPGERLFSCFNRSDRGWIKGDKKMKNTFFKIFAIPARIVLVILLAYLAFFCYVAVHEFLGHLAADAFIYARHGSSLARSEVIVQFLSITQHGLSWGLGLVPFRIGGMVVSAIPSDPITFTNWDIGFGTFMGSGITLLISLIALVVLNLRKNLPHFPWFAGFFSLYSVVFDQILYTFGNPADALDGAVLMGADPLLFKIFIIFLVLLQAFLLARVGFRYQRMRQARAMVNKSKGI